MKWNLGLIATIVGLLVTLSGAIGAFSVAAYRVTQLERQVAAQTATIEALQRSQVELITTLRVKEIIR